MPIRGSTVHRSSRKPGALGRTAWHAVSLEGPTAFCGSGHIFLQIKSYRKLTTQTPFPRGSEQLHPVSCGQPKADVNVGHLSSTSTLSLLPGHPGAAHPMTSHLTSGGQAYSTVPEQGLQQQGARGSRESLQPEGHQSSLGSEKVEMLVPGREDDTRRGLTCSGGWKSCRSPCEATTPASISASAHLKPPAMSIHPWPRHGTLQITAKAFHCFEPQFTTCIMGTRWPPWD